ncbi:PIG-L deacetylase family protein [Pelosinus propionicus]|uniref:N-acetylglucosaminyl deacetylase, LmbE family n=1 Tax=Pelosinus propionicus DSM 13327 TaxID=1123291 RepID=A0A1I4HWC4_9FIRM|nr:PIG-L family deacetylase [Pelosinus propionicus]SFL46492.1 N-acetylglucosaminyl deacetylase, LmbE family [Pelosinus propionicus DSM 13327]
MRLRIIFKILLVTAGLALALYCLSSLYFYYQEKPEEDLQLPSFPLVPKETRLLVIAPHCDDEVLGCGGMIHDVLQAGGQVLVVVMTNGDGFTIATEEEFHRLFLTREDYVNSGYTRQKETIQALQLLGVSEKQIFLLGYPDRGLEHLWMDNWNKDQPYQSRYTGSDHSPYSNSYQKNAPYAGQAVLENLEQIMLNFKPNVIVVPHPADEHPDHAAAWAFAATCFAKISNSGRASGMHLYTYLIHRGDFPIPHGYQNDALLLPPRPLYQVQHSNWMTYPIDLETEVLKEEAIKEYASQTKVPIMSSLLHSFIRKNELFADPYIPYVIQKPSESDLSSLSAWSSQESILVNTRSTSLIGALEHKGKISTIDSYLQDKTIWLHLHIPGFVGKQNQYQVSIVAFGLRGNKTIREKDVLHFSESDTNLPSDAIIRYQDDVIIKIPLTQVKVPYFFFIQVVTKDKHKFMIDHTVWQPVFLNRF